MRSNVSKSVQRMDNWKDIAIGALIAQAIASVWFYLRSISDKVSRKDFEKAIAELKGEIEKTNAEMKSFARLGDIAEVKSDIRRIEAKLEAKLDTIGQQLLMLLARDNKRGDG